jgi:hypothetical protein
MIGGQGIGLPIKALLTNTVTLLAGETVLIQAGHFFITPGPYSCVQFFDQVTQLWRRVKQQTPNTAIYVESDGANFRIANLSGCPVGAVVTNAGSGYTSAPTVVPNAGGSTWRAIVGGLINATFTLPSFKGSNYTYPPIVQVDPPAPGGLPCTAHAVISAGALTSVVIDNQGAGYTAVPTFHFLSDPRDPNNPVTNPGTTTTITPIGTVNQTVQGAQVGDLAATATLTGSGTIAAVVCTNHGNAVTSLPTLAFSGGGGSSAAATVIMNWTVTGLTVVDGGAGYGTSVPFLVLAAGGITAGSPVNTNPEYEADITQIRQIDLSGTTGVGVITATGLKVIDGGIGFQAIPTAIVLTGGTTAVTTNGSATLTVGGHIDTYVLSPAD